MLLRLDVSFLLVSSDVEERELSCFFYFHGELNVAVYSVEMCDENMELVFNM